MLERQLVNKKHSRRCTRYCTDLHTRWSLVSCVVHDVRMLAAGISTTMLFQESPWNSIS